MALVFLRIMVYNLYFEMVSTLSITFFTKPLWRYNSRKDESIYDTLIKEQVYMLLMKLFTKLCHHPVSSPIWTA